MEIVDLVHRGASGGAGVMIAPLVLALYAAAGVARAISDGSAVRSANEERETLPVTSDEKGALPIARRPKR
jgi:hypothetical protein